MCSLFHRGDEMEAAVTEEAYMRLALELAAEAAAEGEVPVGAVICLLYTSDAADD